MIILQIQVNLLSYYRNMGVSVVSKGQDRLAGNIR